MIDRLDQSECTIDQRNGEDIPVTPFDSFASSHRQLTGVYPNLYMRQTIYSESTDEIISDIGMVRQEFSCFPKIATLDILPILISGGAGNSSNNFRCV